MINCPVCESKNVIFYNESRDIEYFSSSKLYRYYSCKSCDVIFLLNPPSDISKIYPKSYYSFNESNNNLYFFFNAIKNYLENQMFKKILKKIKKKKIYCLDIGGASGWISKNLVQADQRIKKITIVDIVSPNIMNTNQNPKIDFVKSKIENFKTKKKYDFVLLLNLIEHVPNPDLVLAKIRNMLNPNGICLIKTPNHRSLNNLIFKNLYWGGLHCPRHFVIFSFKSFLSICKKSKLAIVDYKFTQGFPQWHASFIGSLRRRKILRKKIPIHRHISWILIFPFAIFFDFLILKWIGISDQIFYVLKKNKS